MRTNNSAEAYHRRLNSVFQCAHPTLWVFIQKLIDEKVGTHVDVLQICVGQPIKKKNMNERLEIRLMNLLTNPHQDILVQIRIDSIADNISF